MHCTSTLLIPQFTLLYADDTIVLVETEKELQSALDAVHEYCNNIHLTHKKRVMIFSRGKVRQLSELYVWRLNIRRYL